MTFYDNIKGYSDDKTYRFFEVDETNQLSQLGEMVIDYPYASEHKIRAIEYVDRKWYWKLWVLG